MQRCVGSEKESDITWMEKCNEGKDEVFSEKKHKIRANSMLGGSICVGSMCEEMYIGMCVCV